MATTQAGNPQDIRAIQNTLARYCEALDTKFLDLLDKVFTSDVVANYPFSSHDLKGVDAIRTAILNRLGPIQTHHNLTTQLVTLSSDGKKAFTTTHFIAVHFGQVGGNTGPHEGKALTAYGRYLDELILQQPATDNGGGKNLEGVPGASGVWRISKRNVAFTKRIGDEAIMKEYT